MSKAKSWTKLNRCSANGATQTDQDFGSSEVFLVAEHKVTNTASQQSWATKWNREWQKKKKVRGENKERWQRTGLWRMKMLCLTLKSIKLRLEHSTPSWKNVFPNLMPYKLKWEGILESLQHNFWKYFNKQKHYTIRAPKQSTSR